MPKEKRPLTMHPLSLKEAMADLLPVKPPAKKGMKRKPKA